MIFHIKIALALLLNLYNTLSAETKGNTIVHTKNNTG